MSPGRSFMLFRRGSIPEYIALMFTHSYLLKIIDRMSPSFSLWSNPTLCQSNFPLGPFTLAVSKFSYKISM